MYLLTEGIDEDIPQNFGDEYGGTTLIFKYIYWRRVDSAVFAAHRRESSRSRIPSGAA